MAEFYLDHNTAAGIAGHLRSLGHGARTARDLRLERARDHMHLLTAAQRDWILVTYDWEDFRLLHEAWRDWPRAWGIDPPPRHAGILVIPTPDRAGRRWLPAEAAREIDVFLAQQPPLTDTVYRWWSQHGWVRH